MSGTYLSLEVTRWCWSEFNFLIWKSEEGRTLQNYLQLIEENIYNWTWNINTGVLQNVLYMKGIHVYKGEFYVNLHLLFTYITNWLRNKLLINLSKYIRNKVANHLNLELLWSYTKDVFRTYMYAITLIDCLKDTFIEYSIWQIW